MSPTQRRLKARQRLGQYRIEARLAEGGFAEVYRAYDTVEGIRVALKLPHAHLADKATQTAFRNEVRMVAQLDHPNILPIKTAGTVDGHFVVITPLAVENLEERLARRVGTNQLFSMADQLLDALAYAHRRRIIHCDVKPENVLLFADGRLRLADFGLARVARRAGLASGSGTVGYLAPEQALGKPSLRSDVFAAGLVLYRMLTGRVPEWPFEWPYPRHERALRRGNPAILKVIAKATEVDERQRYKNAAELLRAFRAARPPIPPGSAR